MAKALVLFQLSVLLLSSFTVISHGEGFMSWSLNKHADQLLPPAQAPKPYNRGHHHHPKNAPIPSPAYSPAKPPAKHPVKPPTPSVKPPAKPPVKPPTYSPSKPPVKPPTSSVKPPAPAPYYPSRNPVAVRGLVYCKPCKYRGVETLDQATPLKGAVVKLMCNNTKKTLVEQSTTDKNGFFWILPKKVSSGAYHKCKVFLVKSNNTYCDVPTNFNGGKSGASLKYTPLPKPPAASPHPAVKPPTFDVFTVGPFGFEPSRKVHCKK